MLNTQDAIEEIMECMWFDHFETVLDKRSLAADILRVAANHLSKDEGDHYPPDYLRDIADNLDNP